MGAVSTLSGDNLGPYLARLGRRLRWRDGSLLAQRWLWTAGLGALLVQLAGRVWPFQNLWIWTLAPLAAWLVAVLAITFLRPEPPKQVARRTDLELSLKERLSTALALETWAAASAPPAEDAGQARKAVAAFELDLVQRQRRDALNTARGIDPGQAFPLPWLRRPTLLAGLLLAGTLALALLPNPMDEILAERAAVAQAAEEQAEKIEELEKDLQEAEGLTPEERERLLRELQELAEQLRADPGDRAEALADLSKMEENLRQRLDPNASARQAALESLASQMRSLAGREKGTESDLSAAAEALQELARQSGEMDSDQRQALAESLQQMAARAAQAGQSDLAQALASMAQAAQSGDSQAASQAAQTAAGALSQAQASQADQAALQRALSQLQDSRQAVANAGQGNAVAQGQGQNQGQGQGQGQDPGQGQGQGQSQGQGNQAGSGGGTKANTLPPATRTGKAGRPQGQGQSGGVSEFEAQVFAPWERRQGEGKQLNIPGQETGQGQTQVKEGQQPLPGAPGPALVPYQEVFYNYLDTANQAIESSYIPNGLKDYVRDYFSELEP
jgi:hypothetical protein